MVSFLLLAYFFLSPIYAANDTSSVSMLVPPICKLTIEDSDQTINLIKDASGEAAYEKGYIDGQKNKPVLIVDSNTFWKLSVRVSSDWNMVGSYKKDTEDLLLKITSDGGRQTGFNDFTSLSLYDQEVAFYKSGIGDDFYYGQYRILLNWEKDIPGNYTIIIVFTLSTWQF